MKKGVLYSLPASHLTVRLLQGHGTEKKAFPIFGSIVVNGCAPVLAKSRVVAALKKVDFPAEGLP